MARDDILLGARFAGALVAFLRSPVDDASCRRSLQEGLEARETRLLDVLERGVFARPASTYARLLTHAGVELGDVARLVREHGVEGTLARLYDAGVYVTLDELNGRRPIERPGLVLTVDPSDFENPLASSHYETRSSGSRTPGTSVSVDLELLAHEAAYHSVFLDAFALRKRPVGLWAVAVPVSAGLKNVLRHAKLGLSVRRWFSPTPFRPRRGATKGALFTGYALAASRACGVPIPRPEHVPFSRADRVAKWLADLREAGERATLWTSVSAAARVCLAAAESGLDVSGTTFRVGGEPYTPAKAELVAAAGCDAVCHYSMTEVGKVGIACAAPESRDDVHLLTDKLAVLRRPRRIGADGDEVGALFTTTLVPWSPRLLLNVESGDEAVMTERACGCPLGALGFSTHLHAIRSYEKLTSEGNTFLGDALVELVESVLPGRFGGRPSDYQLVEHEDGGLTRVTLLVSPSVGEIDNQAVVATVVERLSAQGVGQRLTAEIWRDTGTLRVERREPIATESMKVLPLRIEARR